MSKTHTYTLTLFDETKISIKNTKTGNEIKVDYFELEKDFPLAADKVSKRGVTEWIFSVEEIKELYQLRIEENPLGDKSDYLDECEIKGEVKQKTFKQGNLKI